MLVKLTEGILLGCLLVLFPASASTADVDECATATHDCDANADCKNTVGSYECTCKSMYFGNGTYCAEKTCDNNNPCGANTNCRRTAVSFQCTCLPGFTGAIACVDIDECVSTSANNCDVNAQCENTDGSYVCNCNPLYIGNGSFCEKRTCENSNPCGDRTTCSETGTGFECNCLQGYTGAISCTDIDECASEEENDCDSNAFCENTNGSYSCHCHENFTGNGTTCDDIDECAASSTNACDVNANCKNTAGSYSCECKSMFFGNGTYCEKKTCENTKPCGANTECIRTSNSFQCLCLAGFTGAIACSDIDECATASDNDCDVNADCKNTDGSYECSCKTLYIGNGTYCEKQTCENSNPCGMNTDCHETALGLQCTCFKGYTGAIACTDIDECSTISASDCDHNAECINTVGSYSCECKDMFVGNGTFCEDKDECAASDLNDCDVNAVCTNTYGSYECECKTMHFGNGTYCQERTCENSTPCGANTQCQRTPEAFQCICLPGYTGAIACADINECASASDNDCDANAVCKNTEGSYSCSCKSPYSGNGTHCSKTDSVAQNECGECPLFSHCELTDQNVRECSCNTGFKLRGADGCIGHCEASILNNFTFNGSFEGDVSFSMEKCPNGRSRASVTCATVGGGLSFDNTTFYQVTCNETVSSIAKQINWQNSTREELEQGMSRLAVTVSSGNSLDETDRAVFVKSATLGAESLRNKSELLSEQTLRQIIVAADSVTESFAETANKGFVNTNNETVVKQAIALRSAVEVFSAKISMKKAVVSVVTTNIRAQIQTKLSENATEYTYSSPTMRMSIPREAVEQAIAKEIPAADRLVFLEYSEKTLFQSSENLTRVLTVELGIGSKITDLKHEVLFYPGIPGQDLEGKPIPGKAQTGRTKIRCSYYVPENLSFSQSGCRLLPDTGEPTCACDHMTSFAALLQYEVIDDDIALSVVTTTGCIISTVALIAALLLHLTGRNRAEKRQISLSINAHICVSLLAVYLTFLVGISQTLNYHLCMGITALLHYLLLVTWSWTTVYSYAMFNSLARLAPDNISNRFLLKSGIMAYGVPLIISLVTFTVKFLTGESVVKDSSDHSYERWMVMNGYMAPNMCWLTGDSLKFAYLLPAGVMLLANYCVFIYLVAFLTRQRLKMQSVTSRKNATREIIASASMATTLGLTWIFGYLMLISPDKVYRDIMAWLFTLATVLQGLLLFSFTVMRRAAFREQLVSTVRTRLSTISSGISGRMRQSVRSVKKRHLVTNSVKDDDSTNSLGSCETLDITTVSKGVSISVSDGPTDSSTKAY